MCSGGEIIDDCRLFFWLCDFYLVPLEKLFFAQHAELLGLCMFLTMMRMTNFGNDSTVGHRLVSMLFLDFSADVRCQHSQTHCFTQSETLTDLFTISNERN
ncbi:hypothetical protein T08_2071 [Trichinella sp. T8]|nr:hypothetical protein T08_2071 [Trichinella sp. T8]